MYFSKNSPMEIRYKLIVRVLIVTFGLLLLILFLKIIQDGLLTSLRAWVLIIGMPYLLYVSFFVGPGTRILFSEKGISVNFIVQIGSTKIFEKKGWHLSWAEVGNVYSHFPIWLPMKTIGVIGFSEGKRHMFFLGAFTTRKKESLVYLGHHAPLEAIDEDVKRLIDKYRLQLQK